MQRRHRLSRSRDFDAVYRHGRSVSTRFLVLYWFPRDDEGEPRLGIAVPKGPGAVVAAADGVRRLLADPSYAEAARAVAAEIADLPPASDAVAALVGLTRG